jgi:hypothetical protein
MQPSIPQPVFLNVEFIFSWLWGNIFSPLFSINALLFLEFVASILVIIGITIILYCLVRLNEIKQEDAKKKSIAVKAGAPEKTGIIAGLPGSLIIENNETWENIRSKLLSDSPSDWRLAIIEADIYLDRVLDAKGYTGDTIGDKLKNLTTDRLGSLQIAWEAHKVRNRIAHDGAAFVLTMPEARKVLSYFEIVFRDLGVIA